MAATAAIEEHSPTGVEAASETSTPRKDSLHQRFSKAKIDPSTGQEARRSLSFKRPRRKSSTVVLPMDTNHLRTGVSSSFFRCFEGVLGQERYRCVKSNIFLSEHELLVQSGNERLQLDVQSLKSVEVTKEFKNGLYVFRSTNGDLLQLVGDCYSSSSKRTLKMRVAFLGLESPLEWQRHILKLRDQECKAEPLLE